MNRVNHVNLCRWRILAAAAAVLGTASAASAQQTATVTAGERYRASGLHTVLLGEEYRAAWTTPVRVEVLDPDRFAGGLTVTGEGGGLSTESLRLKGRDGREYVFRSVDKNSARAVPEDLQGSFIQDVAQDQTAAKQPAAALVVPPLLRAAGVPHVVPRLYVMPNHPFLGEHRQEFAGKLGQIEERPVDADDGGPAFNGAERVEGTPDFLEELEEEGDNVVDAPTYLKARLMDMMIGDWDRHPDQWRWARYDRGGREVWEPIPRDRDNAFARHEGILMAVARKVAPQLTQYGPEYGTIYGLHYQASALDRQLLSSLDRAAWDSIAQFLRTRVTDAVIDTAVRNLPPEYYAVDGARIRTELMARRDRVPEAAREFYELLSSEVDVYASDDAERAQIARAADGTVTVIVTPGEGARPSFVRRFVPGETREVRLFLRGGDDAAEVTGTGPGDILVRVIGGGGDDRLEDRSTASGGRRTVFYDDRGDNRVELGNEARLDTRPYATPQRRSLVGNPPPLRDYGATTAIFTPHARWQTDVGPVIGFGPSGTRFGFRRQPYATFQHLRFVVAPFAGGVGVEYAADYRRTNRPAFTTILLRANNFETTRFYGFGNETSEAGDDLDRYVVRHNFLAGELLLHRRLAPGLMLAAGPEMRYVDARMRDEHLIATLDPAGTSTFTQAGALARLALDRRDTLAITRSGVTASAEVRGFHWTDGEPFARLSAQAATYVPIGARGPSLAFRAGAETAVGDYPFQEAAFLGGFTSLRGFQYQRFAGDASVFGTAEARQPIGQIRLIARGRLGVLGLVDAGRVYVDGDSDGGWHTAVGGGVYFETVGRVLGLTYARGDSGLLYVHFGLPF
ncbi:MAG TPA: BamA/TamA family outer membrane protein [Longimicrobium sp.]|jgi:hypothetical protein